MATKFPPPNPPFVRARYQGGRQTPKALVLHGTVSSDNRGTARNIADWWAGPTSPVSSCHYVVDPGEVIQCVGDHSIAYHCGYNTGSIGIEFCDEQAGPASRWNDADSNAILRRAARLTAELCLAYGIAPVRPSTADLKRKGPHGIYGHNDSRLAFGGTTHTDPRDFPWAKFLRMVKLEIKELRVAAEPTPPPPLPNPGPKPPSGSKVKASWVRFAHCSMQFSDKPDQMQHDAEKLFRRFAAKGTDIITGTEAGEQPLRSRLRKAAKKHGYRIYINRSCWVAVRKGLVKGGWKSGFEPVLARNASRTGGHAERGIVWVSFKTHKLGRITVAASHYVTRGRPIPGRMGVNVDLNRQIARALEKFARKWGKGTGLVFYGGDQNIVDRIHDTFLGAPFTSLWDELQKWQDTGHGNIDVFATYDPNVRVEPKWINAVDDRAFFLHMDHYLVEGAVRVEHV